MSSAVETIDLVHSFLTDSRIFGVSRQMSGENHFLFLQHREVLLAKISATGTRVGVTSTWLKEMSSSRKDSTTIELSDPQGLNNLIKVLENIVHIFNRFYQTLYDHQIALRGYIRYPKNACGQAKLHANGKK